MYKQIVAVFTVVIVWTNFGYASFKNIGWGTRPAGMGGVFVALSDDANASMWNPAGLAKIPGNEATFMYAIPYSSLGLELQAYNYLGLARTMPKFGSAGFSWANLSHQWYKEDSFNFSYARFLGGMEKKLAVGINFKYLQVSYDTSVLLQPDDQVFVGGNIKSNFSIDMGVLFMLEKMTLGLVLRDINSPDMGLSIPEALPMEIRAGLIFTGIKTSNQMLILPGVEVSSRGKETTFHLGAEVWLANNNIALRGGGNDKEATFGGSYYWPIGGKNKLGIDYCYVFPFNLQNSGGTHRIQTSLKL